MTAQQHPEPAASGPTAERPAKRAGAVISGSVLVIGNLLALLYIVVAWLMVPSGLGDTNHIAGAWFSALVGAVLAVFTAVLTLIAVKARWLGKRWFIVPAVLFVAAVSRMEHIDALYP